MNEVVDLRKCSTHFVRDGSEFFVEEGTRGTQTTPDIARLASGFVIVWADDTNPSCEIGGPDIRAKVFDEAAAALGRDIRVNTETIDHQRAPRVAGLFNSRFVVVWEDFSGRGGDHCSGGIKAKVFASDGSVLRDEFLVNSSIADHQSSPAVAPLGSGGFAVVWKDSQSGRIMARSFQSDFSARGDEFLVSPGSGNHSGWIALAGLSDERFVVIWTQSEVSGATIKGKMCEAEGTTDEFVIAAGIANRHARPSVAALKDGGFVVTWVEVGSVVAPGFNIWARLFRNDGKPSGVPFLVGTVGRNTNIASTLASLSSGGFVIAWTETLGIAARVFGSEGAMPQDVLFVSSETNGGQSSLAVAGLENDTFIIAWESAGQSGSCLTAQKFGPTDPA